MSNPIHQGARRRQLALLLSALWLWCAEPMATERWYLSSTEWSRPRSGAMVMSLPPVQAAVAQLRTSDTGVLTIFFPGGDMGSYWAEELRGWLISLGIASSRIHMVPGSGEADMIGLAVLDRE